MNKLVIALLMVVTVVITGVNVDAKKSVGPPMVTGLGDVTYYPAAGDCAGTTASLLVRIRNGYPDTSYTVSATNNSVAFVTDSSGAGAASLNVATPSYVAERVDVKISAADQVKTSSVYFSCTVVNPNL